MDAATSSTPAPVAPPQEQPKAMANWPRSAQAATVFLLGVATTLLSVHGCRGLRWGSRPTELERGAVLTYRIDLNRADRAELLQVPWLGNSLARQIEDHRRQHGAFQDVSDLRQIRGVGPTTLERLRPWVCVQPAGADQPTEPPTAVTKQPPSRGTSARPPGGTKEAQLTNPININQATVTELQRLPGIGPKRAQLIVDERQKRPFKSVEELRRVPGVGPKTLERMRPCITVESDPVRVVTAGGP